MLRRSSRPCSTACRRARPLVACCGAANISVETQCIKARRCARVQPRSRCSRGAWDEIVRSPSLWDTLGHLDADRTTNYSNTATAEFVEEERPICFWVDHRRAHCEQHHHGGCPTADSGGDAAGPDEDLEWRDAAPNPGLLTVEVAVLRAAAMVLGPSTAVGTLAGIPSVDPRGQATWALGLDVAPGVAGMTHELSIACDSNRGNGAIGVGFGLGGAPSLRRCNQTILDANRP